MVRDVPGEAGDRPLRNHPREPSAQPDVVGSSEPASGERRVEWGVFVKVESQQESNVRCSHDTSTVEAMPFRGSDDATWREFCAWCVERGIDVRFEWRDHREHLSIGFGEPVEVGDYVVKTSGPHSRAFVVREHEFTSDYVRIVDAITACEIARELARH